MEGNARLEYLFIIEQNVKAYKKKLKSHGGSVLAVYSPKGKDGFEIISGAADQNIRSKSSQNNDDLSLET